MFFSEGKGGAVQKFMSQPDKAMKEQRGGFSKKRLEINLHISRLNGNRETGIVSLDYVYVTAGSAILRY